MDNRNLPAEYGHEDEIDLVDLIKILLRNLKFIIVLTFVLTFLAISCAYYLKKNESLSMEQRFTLNNIQDGSIKINPLEIFDNDDIVNNFFEKDIIKKEIVLEDSTVDEKRRVLKNVYNISSLDNTGLNYKISVSSDTQEKIYSFIQIYIKELNAYIETFNKGSMEKDLSSLNKRLFEYEEALSDIEEKMMALALNYKDTNEDINNANNNSVSYIDEIKELNPKLIAKRDTYSKMYNDILIEKLGLESKLAKMDDNITLRSSLYKLDSKIKLRLIAVISCFLGFFLSIFIVFLKEFIKNIDWKD